MQGCINILPTKKSYKFVGTALQLYDVNNIIYNTQHYNN